MSCKKIPYGISDFETLRTDNYYYVDKTRFIREMEQVGTYVFMLRPRRFGKSLFANSLAAYYDVKMADKYEQIFKGLDIYDNPTEKRNQYMVLKFCFSSIDDNPERLELSFNDYVYFAIKEFVKKYAEYLPEETLDEILSVGDNSGLAFNRLINLAKRASRRIYLIIDEYDNFANTLLTYDEAGYKMLTHGTGFFRYFFKQIKDATSENDAAISRMFITGVTPLALSDVTSGFNIGMNLSMDARFNEMMGFTESEMIKMLAYYRDAKGTFKHSVEQILSIIKPYYNNSCFTPKSLGSDRMFNSDMALYFLNNYIPSGDYPDLMIDPNVTSDMNKVRKMLNYGYSSKDKDLIIEQILNKGYITSSVTPEFKLEDLAKKSSQVSLMFYLGLLSYGIDDDGYPALVITNQVVREQYFAYLIGYYANSMGWQTDSDELTELGIEAIRKGDIIPLLSYVCKQMNEQTSNRDFNREGESFVKGYITATIGNNNAWFVCRTEQELNHGYCDIAMRPLQNGKHAYLVELKYLKPSAPDEEVDSCYKQSVSQLHAYAKSHPFITECQEYGWTFHKIALVIRGWKMERLKEIV